MTLRGFLFCFGLMVSIDLVANPYVIYDSGATQPIDKYLTLLDEKEVPDFGLRWLMDNEAAYMSNPPSLQALFPLTTHLSPVKSLPPRRVNFKNVKYPICIIGDDPWSLQWLMKVASHIKQRQGLCWVIAATSIRSFQRLRATGNGVVMLPANGDDIARFFQLTGYPVMISKGLITQ